MCRTNYKSLTAKQKLEIIDLVEKARLGKKKKEIATELSILPSTLSTILKNKATLRVGHAFGNKQKMRHRDPSGTDVDCCNGSWQQEHNLSL